MTDLSDEVLRSYAEGRYIMTHPGVATPSDVMAMARELSRRREADQWHPIATAPDTGIPETSGQRLWLFSITGIQFSGFRFSRSSTKYVDPHSGHWRKCSHWRPLPSPPEGAP